MQWLCLIRIMSVPLVETHQLQSVVGMPSLPLSSLKHFLSLYHLSKRQTLTLLTTAHRVWIQILVLSRIAKYALICFIQIAHLASTPSVESLCIECNNALLSVASDCSVCESSLYSSDFNCTQWVLDGFNASDCQTCVNSLFSVVSDC